MIPITDLPKYLPNPETLPTSVKQEVRGKVRKTIRYIDLPICFDIEAYSFREVTDTGEEVKRAVMWVFGLAIGDVPLLGRTWPDFVDALDTLSTEYGLCDTRRMIVWVHNLGYEFQFIRHWFGWKNVFALDPRRVCYAVTDTGIEFRCSYILTGYALEKIGEHLVKHTVRKLSGEIDYHLPRHPGTPLTGKEIAYIENDVLVVTAHIAEQIEIEKGLAHIPLTKTGYPRRYVRKACFRDPSKKRKDDYTKLNYSLYMQSLTMAPFQYRSCKRAFQGGFTHANPCYVGTVMEDVTSLDIISCYPAQILSGLYPVSPPSYVAGFKSEEEFREMIKKCCCVFTITFYDLKATIQYDHYLSYSHCDVPQGKHVQLSNGRVVWAEELTTTITNLDFFIIDKMYKWAEFTVSGFIKWQWGYLPKPIIESTLYMYEQKTQLKDKEGSEVEYQSLKEMLNSIYGMMVTDPLRPEIPYDMDTGQWGKEVDGFWKYKIPLSESQQEKALEDYNNDPNRFTYYPWGIFITAYARHMLWSCILEFKDDYIYSDTDSIKCINYDTHKKFIEEYNDYMTGKIHTCLNYYGIDTARSNPETVDHVHKQLGSWEVEKPYPGTEISYKRFKTLGAKRYMVEGPKGLSITVSGINKKDAVPYIQEVCKKEGIDPFDFFTLGMVIPPGHAGKLIPRYGDEEARGIVTDHTGTGYEYYEKSYLSLEEGGYSLTISRDFVAYLTLLERGFLF